MGDTVRTDKERMVTVTEWIPIAVRSTGRPWLRWENDVRADV